MPTKTFFRLDQEKQDKIVAAAKKEFSDASFHEAAISNIVKESGISRGSFYQYFTDKEDLFYYCLDLIKEESEMYYLKLLEMNQRDFFATNIAFFNYLSEVVLTGNQADLYKNIFLYMNYKSSHKIFDNHQQSYHKKKLSYETLFASINSDQLTIDTVTDFELLFKVIVSMIFMSINDAYRQKSCDTTFDIKKIQAQFAKKMTWIQLGIVERN
ncbi:hypothetical protein CBF34_01890 [Vagococcus penaei]|uniref:Uncharacterized protein n=1 Tax=Vagococcus penaei TaxID=633807 RepID=A0A1Q2D7J0_9ENTE|nr:TetR/AcrR family transcriptional regulator [Vagococcus penaei]AQP54386.1 hypothetical protein BW732_09205 [Vagococcus penaei]RSU06301.1 hypothetical protein CBF34_01890 [Vagococcus penaei]